MTKPVILTGLRANNDLTLGNYFGGILPMIDMAQDRSDEFQINMFIPDLHSFTTPIDHSSLYKQILHTAKIFVAAGLPMDNPNIHLYRQSYVPAHSELTWILDNFTRFGEMTRMTQFKDKSRINKERADELTDLAVQAATRLGRLVIEHGSSHDKADWELITRASLEGTVQDAIASSVGLFNYPVLMAADILLYGAQYVPVGDDQTQHLEFTRDIAERMNTRFGELFVVPEPVKKQHEFFGKDQGLRVMDLVDPTKKMSKSDESGKGVIFLSDDPELAAKKVMGATTDDKANVVFDRQNQPGVSNLIEILALLRGQSVDQTAAEFAGVSRYGDFKQVVAGELKQFLTDFQSKLASVDMQAVERALVRSEETMNIQANERLYAVQRAVGLRPKA